MATPDHDYEALAAALQLLLADVPDTMKRALLYRAFPGSSMLILLDSPTHNTRDMLAENNRALTELMRSLDGQSPLGAQAAKNLGVLAAGVHLRHCGIVKMLGFDNFNLRG